MESYMYKALNRTNDKLFTLCRSLEKQKGKITRSRIVVAILVVKVALMTREIDELRQRLASFEKGAGGGAGFSANCDP